MSEQKLKPCEGLCIKLPNGKPALQFITYRCVTVKTLTKENRVRVIVDFDEPFIKKRTDND